MPIQVLLPALSPTMTTGNLAKWHKKEGDWVKAGEIIAEVETDKAIMEIEASDEGRIAKIFVPEKTQEVPVGEMICLLLAEGEDESLIATFHPTSASIKPQEASQSKPEPLVHLAPSISKGDKIFASPLAKRIASQQGINLANIQGSGPNGRIIKADVLNYQPTLPAQALSEQKYIIEPLNSMRKIIASRLLESKITIPHFYLSSQARVDELIKLREQINQDRQNKISINDFVVKAVALALVQFPAVNSSWSDEGIRKYSNVDVCVAVSVDGGLITPIIHQADLKSLSQISSQVKDLASRARENKLKPEEFQGGGFTISNLGMFGVSNFCAIINPPQSAILAVGATEKKAVINNDKVEVASVMEFTLSCDHRIVDGVLGANFLKQVRQYLENPVNMLV